MIGEIVMKKIIILLILLTTVINCGFFDAEEWDEVERRREERGVKCYRNHNGYFYCRDRDGNPYP